MRWPRLTPAASITSAPCGLMVTVKVSSWNGRPSALAPLVPLTTTGTSMRMRSLRRCSAAGIDAPVAILAPAGGRIGRATHAFIASVAQSKPDRWAGTATRVARPGFKRKPNRLRRLQGAGAGEDIDPFASGDFQVVLMENKEAIAAD